MDLLIRDEITTQKLRVLVVEDEGIIARDITSMLEDLGYEVSGQAGTGAEALHLASTMSTDLVLMDIKIRGAMDGIQTAAAVRERFDIPVVFLTSHADSDTLQRANKTEPFGYVVKPFNEADLKVAIEVGFNRHRLQQRVEAKQEWFDTALKSIGDAVIATNIEGRIQFFNRGAEALTGWTAQTALGRRFQEVVNLRDDRGEGTANDLEYVIAQNDSIPFTSALIRHQDGSERPIVGTMAPMRREGSAPLYGAVVILREAPGLAVTGHLLDQRDAFLQRSNKHLQELSYALSHDLREPVRNVTCFAQLLGRQAATVLDEESREFLKFIVEGSQRMESQLGALREFHQAGQALNAAAQTTNVAQICNQAWRALTQEIPTPGALLQVDHLPSLDVSPAALSEIFRHLLSNAIRFRSERPLLVSVGALRSDDSWQFTVEDNGLGFEPDQTERVFRLFTKAHEPKRCGNGVGLAICRRLVEGVGGRVWAESVSGKGSRFSFTVPLQRVVEDVA